MTTYQNPKNQTGYPGYEPQNHRSIITKVCLDCYRHAQHRQDFHKNIRLIKQLILQPSKTPALDEAYLDGITAILSFIMEDTP